MLTKTKNKRFFFCVIYTIPFIFRIVKFSFSKIISLLSCWNATRVCIAVVIIYMILYRIHNTHRKCCLNNVFRLNNKSLKKCYSKWFLMPTEISINQFVKGKFVFHLILKGVLSHNLDVIDNYMYFRVLMGFYAIFTFKWHATEIICCDFDFDFPYGNQDTAINSKIAPSLIV